MEPRQPEVSEVDVTPSEWASLEDDVLRGQPPE